MKQYLEYAQAGAKIKLNTFWTEFEFPHLTGK